MSLYNDHIGGMDDVVNNFDIDSFAKSNSYHTGVQRYGDAGISKGLKATRTGLKPAYLIYSYSFML